MAIKIPLYLISQNRKIANLYKKWLRYLEGQSRFRAEYRYKATLARAEFDHIINEKDMRRVKQMILDKEEEFLKTFVFEPPYFTESPEGVAFQRETLVEDWVLDYWHPFEKAEYPEYFARRELRKQQFVEMWEKKHGPPPPCDDH